MIAAIAATGAVLALAVGAAWLGRRDAADGPPGSVDALLIELAAGRAHLTLAEIGQAAVDRSRHVRPAPGGPELAGYLGAVAIYRTPRAPDPAADALAWILAGRRAAPTERPS